MFRPDIAELIHFYQTPLGELTAVFLRSAIRKQCPEYFRSKTRNDRSVLGIGFAGPYMRMFIPRSARSIAAMPSQQGVYYWPEHHPSAANLALLTEEAELPLADVSADNLILVHALEYSHDPYALMREVWRVLKPEGKLLIIVPNRKGIWARTDKTPFGHGRPFSSAQLEILLNDTMFSPQKMNSALFPIPSQNKLLLKTGKLCEGTGRLVPVLCGGVLIASAQKNIYSATAIPVTEEKRELVYGRSSAA